MDIFTTLFEVHVSLAAIYAVCATAILIAIIR